MKIDPKIMVTKEEKWYTKIFNKIKKLLGKHWANNTTNNNLTDSRLHRRDFIEFINNKFNYRKDDISKLTVDVLDEIYSELLKYNYNTDDRFYTYCRRDFLQKEIDFYLANNQLLDAFVNFCEYVEANTWIDLASTPEGLNIREVLDNDSKYKEDGIICEEEKNKIIEMINTLKDSFLDNLKELNTKIPSKLLEDTIYDLKNNPNACTLMGGTVSKDGHFYAHTSMPGKQLSEFIDYLYEKDLLDKDYMKNIKVLQNKKIKDMTYDEVITAITSIIRGDRFCSRLLYTNFKDGTILKLLKRLNKL